jgi:hypothetical protein
MEREQLEHLIRAAAEVTQEYELIVVGSQSLLGSVPHPPEHYKHALGHFFVLR